MWIGAHLLLSYRPDWNILSESLRVYSSWSRYRVDGSLALFSKFADRFSLPDKHDFSHLPVR
jgi:hypothetical protein